MAFDTTPAHRSPVISAAQLSALFAENNSRARTRNLKRVDDYVAAQIVAAGRLPRAEAAAYLRRAIANVQAQATQVVSGGFNRHLCGLTVIDLSNAISALEAALVSQPMERAA